jgi:hypothetical protein
MAGSIAFGGLYGFGQRACILSWKCQTDIGVIGNHLLGVVKFFSRLDWVTSSGSMIPQGSGQENTALPTIARQDSWLFGGNQIQGIVTMLMCPAGLQDLPCALVATGLNC